MGRQKHGQSTHIHIHTLAIDKKYTKENFSSAALSVGGYISAYDGIKGKVSFSKQSNSDLVLLYMQKTQK